MIRLEVSPFTPISLFAQDPTAPAPAHAIGLARHAFEVDADGLKHYTDGNLRAIVPPEGWDDYVAHYETAREVVAAHRAAVAAAQSGVQS